MIKKLTRLLCRSEIEKYEREIEKYEREIEKYEREIEELKEEIWKRKAKPSNPVLIKESKNQCLVMRCVCGNEIAETFEREDGFDFICANCKASLSGMITGFSEDIKKKFSAAHMNRNRRKNKIHEHLNELNNLVGTGNAD